MVVRCECVYYIMMGGCHGVRHHKLHIFAYDSNT